ncbi:MAG: 3-dehydroquinate synthase, partial [Bacteroidia bacterium]|nr:3-dehydroquinate synthase [Bacteroidia bacterium]
MYQQHFEEYNKLSTINSLLCQIQYTLQAKGYDGVYFIVDKNVFRYYQEEIFLKLQKIEEKIVLIEADELYKNQAQCQKVWSFFVQKNVSRRALVIIIGGGITLDLGAFACSTWKRGVAFILVPSTLLAMADACIGGKTGINFQGIKNLVGTFAFPQEIWIAPELLKTLPARIFRCGLSEIFKTALVADLNLWNKICGISEWKG